MTENKKILKVLNGFTKLNDSEKNILVQEVLEFLKGDSFDRRHTISLLEQKMSVGPTGDNHCPCCGKG